MAAAMTIQIFLTGVLAIVGTMVALQRTTSRLLRLAVLVVVGVGLYFVWVPDQTTQLAAALGVGRGADLVLYVWVVITLALIVFLYLKIVQLSRRLTELTRAQALSRPELPSKSGESR
jgi:small membrane protein